MRLKRVRIFGFKTFADRTDFNVDGGIIAVVGPNGCGKSNLVDAILWALGESNARHLRANTSQDVIFNGSARRKPVGFAEVSLLFDNEDGALPIDSSEVSVSRRLNRAGESEYFINKRPCRQRDVHELLADSGLGRSGYAIVGQKDIDQALAASPEDRRAWVDEAAGVQRYRARKIESLRRLASAKEHLVRVDDILRELDAQREPLREEAEVARQYKAATAALREIESGLLMKELAKAVREIATLESRLSNSVALARKESERAEELDRLGRAERERLAEIEHDIEGIRSRLQDATAAAERASAEARLGEERLRSLDDLEQTLRSGDGDEQLAQAEAELEACAAEERAEAKALEQAMEMAGGADERARSLSGKLREAEELLASARERHALRLKLQAQEAHRRERLELLRREIEGIERDLPALRRAREDAAKEAETLLAAFSAAEQALKRIEAEQSELRQEEDALGGRVRNMLAERAALEGRRRGIEQTILAHEGLAQGSRAVLQAAAEGRLAASYTPVGQALEAKKAHALAIETALGASANDLIVDREADAKAAIQYLKENRLGRATFQPIPLMRPQEPGPEMRRLLAHPSVVGRASELAACESAHRPVIDSLLGRVLVVRDLDAALGLAKTGGWSRLVTLDGEVIHSSGAVSGGTTGKPQYGLVQRQADLAEIETSLTSLEREIAGTESQLAETTTRRQALLTELAQAEAELSNARTNLDEARDYLHTISAELAAADRSREKLGQEEDSLRDAIEIGADEDTERLQIERDAVMTELAGRSADANQAKLALQSAESRLEQAKGRTAAVRRRLELARQTHAQRAAKLENLGPERERLRLQIERHEKDAESWRSRALHAEADVREAQARKDAALQDSLRLAEEAKSARQSVAAMTEASHQDELNRARAESRRAAAAERLLEEYSIGEEEALEQADRIEVPPDAQPLANRLRREIRAMGNVNVGADEAYERLALRHDELSAQRADITEGMEQVQASMRELDRLTRDRFLDTFGKVEEAYGRMFHKLFGGGEGRIFLDKPDSILESGIEIEVTLPGKKRQRLELLSGGERALCAAGFLFALLEVKPSPLVVLDEVDAPLDGRNVERFGDLLLEFTDRTQFIVITHNPTTIERAPVWLGITMQEPGVSTLVPVRLPSHAVAALDVSPVSA